MTFSTTFTGDLDIFLTSPDGTVSQLIDERRRRQRLQRHLDLRVARRSAASAPPATWSVRIVDDFGGDALDRLRHRGPHLGRRHRRRPLRLHRRVLRTTTESAATPPRSATRNGGTDTVNAAAVSSASKIRLDGARRLDRRRRRCASPSIEHAIGGDGNDRLVGDRTDEPAPRHARPRRFRRRRGRVPAIGRELSAGRGATCSRRPGRFRFRSVDELPFGDGHGRDRWSRRTRLRRSRRRAAATVIVLRGSTPTRASPATRRSSSMTARRSARLRCIDAGSVDRVLGFTDGDAAARRLHRHPRRRGRRRELRRGRLRALSRRPARPLPEMERRPRGAPGRWRDHERGQGVRAGLPAASSCAPACARGGWPRPAPGPS